MTASPGDGEHAAREGYYPDPSIPGFVRYWNGLNWVPGTSRPAPAAAPAPAVARSDETGPVFLDETGVTEALPEPEPEPGPEPLPEPAAPAAPAASWQADPLHQSGFGGPRDHRVSWGSPAQPEPEPDGGHAPALSASAGVSQGRGPRPEPLEAAERAPRGPGVSFARTAERFPAQAAVRGSAESVGILSARSPAAPAPAPAPVEPEWPAAPGGSAGPSGLTSSWPQTPLRRDPSPRPEPEIPAGWDPMARPEPEAPPRRDRATRPEPEAPSDPAPWSQAPPRRDPAARPEPEAAVDRAAWSQPPVRRDPAARPAPGSPGAPVRRDAAAWPEPEAQADPFVPEEPQAAQAPAARRPVPAGQASAPAPRRAAAPAEADPGLEAGPAPAAGRGVPRVTERAVFERMAERAIRPAGLVRRAVARTLDTLVLGAVAAGVARPLVPAATAHLEAKVDAAMGSGRTTTVWLFDTTIAGYLGLVLGAVLLFGVFYEVLPTARWGRTPGKKLLGIRVLSAATLRPPTFGAALRRWLVYAVLGLPGSLWCLGDRPRRRGWHDRAAKTYVAR
ncbi:RDD family protein [Streptomyces sp. NRRL S-244]|uniref:RDD family protein n=1 Tax=Streptomyces sp. NRRL S-244 TaxID=1463897 RepID=UPI0004C29BF0|nr:RDD family protein [Streptomyces sp. NRRL S-244]